LSSSCQNSDLELGGVNERGGGVGMVAGRGRSVKSTMISNYHRRQGGMGPRWPLNRGGRRGNFMGAVPKKAMYGGWAQKGKGSWSNFQKKKKSSFKELKQPEKKATTQIHLPTRPVPGNEICEKKREKKAFLKKNTNKRGGHKPMIMR